MPQCGRFRTLNLLRRCVSGLALLCVFLSGAVQAASAPSPEALKAAGDMASLLRDSPPLEEVFVLLRRAGAAYDPRWAAPQRVLLECREGRDFGMVMGIYLADAVWAETHGAPVNALAHEEVRLLGFSSGVEWALLQGARSVGEESGGAGRFLRRLDAAAMAAVTAWDVWMLSALVSGVALEETHIVCRALLTFFAGAEGKAPPSALEAVAALVRRMDAQRRIFYAWTKDSRLVKEFVPHTEVARLDGLLLELELLQAQPSADKARRVLAKVEKLRSVLVSACPREVREPKGETWRTPHLERIFKPRWPF